ncbi:MAG: hypothetical protein OEW42_00940 [Acidimicrobiia bacterium]|nr:hypothetical protein [Acidimicrobiia bacterium]MDH5236760.1 hypothetical protein [Acidimicrobiia bacterium]
MDILAALYIDNLELRPVDGGATHIDITGIKFSGAAPEPVPFTWTPHMVVLVRCPPDESGTGALEVVFRMDGDEVARNAQPLQVEPGKFAYRLVQAELEFAGYDTVEAHCRIDMGPVTVVPFTMLEPAD